MDGFYMSGPEEGDKVDQSVFVCDDSGEELIEVKHSSLARRREIGRRLAHWLNMGECEITARRR